MISGTKKFCLAILILDLLAGGTVYLLYSKIQGINTQVEVMTAAADKKFLETGSLTTLRSAIEKTAGIRATLDTHFVGANDVVGFLDYIESLGREQQLVVTLGSVAIEQTASTTKSAESLNLSVAVVGDWRSVYRFSKLLETVPYLVDIEGVDLSALGKNEKDQLKIKKPGTMWRGTFALSVLKLK